jgi:thiol-disulfide isomerase/thioredoxin
MVVILAAAGLTAAGGFYATRGASGNGACPASAALSAKVAPLATGQIAALKILPEPRPAPDLVFFADKKPKRLSDFKGQSVLVNLWATWCVPCRSEMPTLDQLEGELGGPKFQVVAINIDQRNLDKPKTFLQEAGVKHLAYYNDQSVNVFQDMKKVVPVEGLPVSMLVGSDGCALGVINGPADWASAEALKLVKATLPKG